MVVVTHHPYQSRLRTRLACPEGVDDLSGEFSPDCFFFFSVAGGGVVVCLNCR